jgi:hypothetical protein
MTLLLVHRSWNRYTNNFIRITMNTDHYRGMYSWEKQNQ